MNSRFAQGSSVFLALVLSVGLLPVVLGDEDSSDNGYLEIWVESDFDDQWGDLYIGDGFVDEYWVEYSGEAYLLDNLSLDAGDYVVTLKLDNDASCQEEVTVIANHTSDVLLYPVLENHAPTLHEAWVDPQEGSSETDFTFEVYYRDADNDAPEWVKLRLDNAENYFHMEKDNESDDYVEGVWYRRSMSELEEGEHSYQYITSDGDAMAETEWQEGPWVDNGDEAYGWLNVWSINDFDGQWGWLQLGDEFYDEYEVPHGEHLLEELELEEGWYWLELELENDAWDGREVYVEAGETTGVELRPEHDEENHAPELRDGHVEPVEGTPETEFTFSVIYSDADGDAPHYVKLRLDYAEPAVMSRDSDGDGGFGEGVLYSVRLDGLEVGVHEYGFIASDGKQAVDTDWREGPVVHSGAYGVAISIEPLLRAVSPGSNASFSVTVLNTGGQEDTFDLATQIIYTNSSVDGWSVTLSEQTVTLGAGDFTTVTTAVTIPADAAEKDTLVFAVSAASRGDSSVAGQAVASVVATQDDSFLPGPSVAATIAAVGGAGVVASFRRRLRD